MASVFGIIVTVIAGLIVIGFVKDMLYIVGGGNSNATSSKTSTEEKKEYDGKLYSSEELENMDDADEEEYRDSSESYSDSVFHSHDKEGDYCDKVDESSNFDSARSSMAYAGTETVDKKEAEQKLVSILYEVSKTKEDSEPSSNESGSQSGIMSYDDIMKNF